MTLTYSRLNGRLADGTSPGNMILPNLSNIADTIESPEEGLREIVTEEGFYRSSEQQMTPKLSDDHCLETEEANLTLQKLHHSTSVSPSLGWIWFWEIY